MVLKFNQSTEFFFFLQVERTFLVRRVHQKLAFLTLNCIPELKMHPSNLRRHKKSKNNRTKFTYDNRASEGKQINKKSESFVCSLTLFSSRKLRTSQIKTGRNLSELIRTYLGKIEATQSASRVV